MFVPSIDLQILTAIAVTKALKKALFFKSLEPSGDDLQRPPEVIERV